MKNLEKTKQEKCQPPPPRPPFKKICPCTILLPPFLIFQDPPTLRGRELKFILPPPPCIRTMQVYIFLSQICLQEKEEYENYLRIASECLMSCLYFSKAILRSKLKYEGCKHTKTKAHHKNISCNSFVVYFSYNVAI